MKVFVSPILRQEPPPWSPVPEPSTREPDSAAITLFSRALSCLLWAGLLTSHLGASQLEQPLGLVLASQGTALHRSGDASALEAKVGDILFAGELPQNQRRDSHFPVLSARLVAHIAHTER